jgi:DUF971 family protein
MVSTSKSIGLETTVLGDGLALSVDILEVSALEGHYTLAAMKQTHTPTHLDLHKDTALQITWADGRESSYPIAYLRRMSPSADMRELRKQMVSNPLTILPDSGGADELIAVDAEMVGNYAIRITFSDGHSTGIYSWDYLREIDPQTNKNGRAPGDDAAPHNDPLGLGS